MYIQDKKWRENWDEKPKLKSLQFLPNTDKTKFTREQDSIFGVIYEDLSKNSLTIEQKDKKVAIGTITMKGTNEYFVQQFTLALTNTVTDFYIETKSKRAKENMDILVRQTDLVVAAAKTGKTVNLKKGQFMSPESMKHAVQKVLDCHNENIMVTDRGTMFGYQDMIVDFRGIPTMQQFASTVLDVTHSLQQPNQMTGVTGGRPDMIETIAKAGIAVGVDGIFIETHFDPSNAKSDGANMLHLDYFESLMTKLVALRKTVNQF